MGTYLEDALESMYMLPSEIKRNFDLMRELDKVMFRSFDVFVLWWPTREARPTGSNDGCLGDCCRPRTR